MSTPQQRRRNVARRPITAIRTTEPVTARKVAAPKTQQKSTWHWSLSLTLAFFFGGSIITLAFRTITIISWTMILLSIVSIGGLAAVAQLSWFKKLRKKNNEGDHLMVGKQLYFAYNFFGIGVFGTALILTLNFVAKNGEPEIEMYQILGLDKDYTTTGGLIYVLEDNAFPHDPEFRWFESSAAMQKATHPYACYYFYKGLFGFRIIGERFLSTDKKGSNLIEQPYIE
ncbi:MAG: hypothetical protein ACKOXB_15410 [Flavobacteriales bacterium]